MKPEGPRKFGAAVAAPGRTASAPASRVAAAAFRTIVIICLLSDSSHALQPRPPVTTPEGSRARPATAVAPPTGSAAVSRFNKQASDSFLGKKRSTGVLVPPRQHQYSNTPVLRPGTRKRAEAGPAPRPPPVVAWQLRRAAWALARVGEEDRRDARGLRLGEAALGRLALLHRLALGLRLDATLRPLFLALLFLFVLVLLLHAERVADAAREVHVVGVHSERREVEGEARQLRAGPEAKARVHMP